MDKAYQTPVPLKLNVAVEPFAVVSLNPSLYEENLPSAGLPGPHALDGAYRISGAYCWTETLKPGIIWYLCGLRTKKKEQIGRGKQRRETACVGRVQRGIGSSVKKLFRASQLETVEPVRNLLDHLIHACCRQPIQSRPLFKGGARVRVVLPKRVEIGFVPVHLLMKRRNQCARAN